FEDAMKAPAGTPRSSTGSAAGASTGTPADGVPPEGDGSGGVDVDGDGPIAEDTADAKPDA
ncbi:MAG: hypothetical protein ACPF8Y_07785, partial [Flavobacteriales bacterium]